TRYGNSENSWLLIKERDQFATGDDVLAEDLSALSSRSMDEIAKGKVVWQSKKPKSARSRKKKLVIDDAPVAPMPTGIRPMLATSVKEPFDRKGWLFEVKWDGYRAIAEVEGEQVRLYSRNQNSLVKDFPSIVEALRRIGQSVVLDGEIVVLDEHGVSHFSALH